MFPKNPELHETCGVAFFAIRRDADNGKGAAFVGGRGDNAIACIAAAGSENKQVCELIMEAAKDAAIRRISNGILKR